MFLPNPDWRHDEIARLRRRIAADELRVRELELERDLLRKGIEPAGRPLRERLGGRGVPRLR